MLTRKMMNIAILISVALLITGCATGGKDSILPQKGPTMKQVYEGHFEGKRDSLSQQQTADEKAASETAAVKPEGRRTGSINRHVDNTQPLAGYTRSAENEIQQIFQRLKNPTLVMYVFPHLSQRERHPIPGYSTGFTFYKRVEYALPGESMEGY